MGKGRGLLDLDNPFWRFSLSLYGADGVKDECIALQDALDINVNVLLFAAWLGAERGAKLTAADLDAIEAEISPWQDAVVRPLRQVRLYLKTLRGKSDGHERLARIAAQIELDAEQIQQAMLFALAKNRWPASHGPGSRGAAQANLEALIRGRGTVVRDGQGVPAVLPSLVRALAAHLAKGEAGDGRQAAGEQ